MSGTSTWLVLCNTSGAHIRVLWSIIEVFSNDTTVARDVVCMLLVK